MTLLTPLFVSSSILFPYTAPKAFAFRILIEIAAVFYLYLLLKKSPLIVPPFIKGGRGGILTLAVLAFLLMAFLSAVFGVDFYLSFWGSLERMLGVWGMAHFIVFFVMLGNVFKTKSEWLKLLGVSVAVSSLVAFLAILQKFFDIGLLMPKTDRVFATLGNAAFLAGYLIFNFFFALYLAFLQAKNKNKAIFAVLVFCLAIIFSAIFLTGTRGAFLGLAAGLIFFALAFGFFNPLRKSRKYFLAAAALIFVFAFLIFFFRHSAFIKENFVLSRLASFSLQETTAKNRLILWQSAWSAWQERPMLGWGQENYEAAINKYFDSRLNLYEAWYDRAHNFIFDYGVAGGWLGLAAYLAVIFLPFYYFLKIIKKQNQENFAFVVLFGSLLFAYLGQNFFVFDSFVSYLMLFFALAFINFVYRSDNGFPLQESQQNKPAKIKTTPLNFGKKLVFFAVIITAAILFHRSNIKPILASFKTNQILSSDPQNFEETNSSLEKILFLKTFASGELVYQINLDYLAKINSVPHLTQNEKFYKLTSSELSENINRYPWRLRNYIALGWLNLYFYGSDPEKIKETENLAQKARELAPAKKDAYFVLLAAYSLNGEKEKAEKLIEEIKKKDMLLGEEISQYWQSLR